MASTESKHDLRQRALRLDRLLDMLDRLAARCVDDGDGALLSDVRLGLADLASEAWRLADAAPPDPGPRPAGRAGGGGS